MRLASGLEIVSNMQGLLRCHTSSAISGVVRPSQAGMAPCNPCRTGGALAGNYSRPPHRVARALTCSPLLRRPLDRRSVLCKGLVVPLPALESVHTSFGAAGLWAALIACATALVVGAVVAACVVCLRPLLKTLQLTVQAFESTAKELEKAAKGVEKATLVFQLDVPHTLGSIERAGNEIASIGRSINIMGGGGEKKKKKKRRKPHAGWESTATQSGEEPELFGRHGMQRVVQDISTMTSALGPSMELWRKRLGDVSASFERASRQAPPAAEEAAAEDAMLASSSGNSEQADSMRQQNESWLDEWRRLATNATDMASGISKGNAPPLEAKQGMADSMKAFAVSTVKEANAQAEESIDDDDDEEAGLKAHSNGTGESKQGDIDEETPETTAQIAVKAAEGDDKEASAMQQGLGLSEDDEELLQQLLSRQEVAHALLQALSRAQVAAAAAADASDHLQATLVDARAGRLSKDQPEFGKEDRNVQDQKKTELAASS